MNENIKLILKILIPILLIIVYLIICKNYQKFSNSKDIIFNIINLKRSKKRWSNIKSQLINLKLNFKRINGIDGLTHKFSKNEEFYFRNMNNDTKKSNGIIAVALSHFYLWKKMIKENLKNNIICEDDIIFNTNFLNEFNNLKKEFKLYDVIFFYNTNKKKKDNENKIINYNKLNWYGFGCVMYYLSINGAKYLINKIEKEGIFQPIDLLIVNQFKNIKIGYTEYPLVTLRDIPSVKDNIIKSHFR